MEEYIPKSKVLELWRYWKFIEAYDQTKAMKGIGIDRLDDGTLVVAVDDATKVTRVLVEDGKYGDLYYADRPQGEWIPCSERLPEKERATYLICTENGYMCSCRWTNDMYGLGSNEWSGWGWHIMDKPQYAKVVAWMSIEPWKGADDDTD